MTTSPHTTPEATDRERRDLFDVLPPSIRKAIEGQPDPEDLLEVVLDLGRPPQARFAGKDIHLGCADVSRDDLDHVTARVGDFGDDNRAGIERTLHRISAIRNRRGEVIGLTCRVGRAVHGSARVIEDLALSGKSILLVGRPGVGKTTILRELARVLADASKRVIIVDTSNEIAGDGDIPHPAIGRARRMQVATPSRQHAVMIEAVENHMPQVIIVDEMGTELEAIAARTIAERGVQLVATAHGNTLENLLVNPTLSDLVGGVQTVTLGDEEARRRRTQKTILERKAPPTFDVLVEIQSWNSVAVHADVAKTVDAVLRGRTVTPETRELDESGTVRRSYQRAAAPPEFEVAPFIYGQERERRYGPEREHRPRRYSPISYEQDFAPSPPAKPAMRVHPFGVSRERLLQSAGGAGLAVKVADSLSDADVVLTTKAHYRRRASVLVAAEEQGVPVYVLRRNTPGQIVGFIEQLTETDDDGGSHHSGAAEAEEGVQRILAGEASTIELRPQSSFVRRIQHRIAEQAQLRSHSVGREPRRRVTIRRTQ
ncbi:MAG: AAA family ATPase [Chloroflexi bacterium]|nr:AAA family ATPase [Chloroflexota bacterium]MYK35424.1 AAA family ATPase [Chloroflexota bacterium]